MEKLYNKKIESFRRLFITPEYISQLINFYPNKSEAEWVYNANGTDMRNLQVKGSARVFNLLEQGKLALLADEVGMGKTLQALSVCTALWNQKPGAKILILAPRDEIAKNWEKEYRTFITHHYRYNDNIVKSISGNEPVRKMVYCSNLYSLVHQIQQGWGQLFIGKISSFSSLMAGNNSVCRLEELGIKNLNKVKRLSSYANNTERQQNAPLLNREIISLLKNEILQHAEENKPYFDLIIIDEAHYFRKKDGDSLKVNTAREFFGDPESENYVPLSKRTLLLTATPNHSSSRDIVNIVSYFTKKYSNSEYKQILDAICVRRLRRLGKNGRNKYNYRKEISSPSNFNNNPLSEMFFGLYQHELAKEANRNKSEKKGRGVSRIMKYLEGIEFIPVEKQESAEGIQDEFKEGELKDDELKSNSTDYTSGSDAALLLSISKKFKEIFDENPKHPKYDKLVEDLTENNKGEKSVIFVRRIPSVNEIAKRIIEFYDKRMWTVLQKENLAELSFEKLTRKNFRDTISKKGQVSKDDSEPAEDTFTSQKKTNEEVKEQNIPSSKVLNLFKVVKDNKKKEDNESKNEREKELIKSTHASNFRLRFTHSKGNIFAMFFSPGEDYFSRPYSKLISLRFETGADKSEENFYNSALLYRTDKINDEGISKDILSTLLPKNPVKNSGKSMEEIETLLTVFWQVFLNDEAIEESRKESVKNSYFEFSYYEKEAFSNFLEKGSLLASEGLVWFYEIFRKLQEDEKPYELYKKFIQNVKQDLCRTKLYSQIQESILHFRSIYTKVFSIHGEKKLLEEPWDSFNNAQPIYPYNAANSNQKVLKCFNTPFFPDILVATSVLQEGVNLQLFCNTIYHYGMAWTPGDNEQRIGRIDRMFGKIERLLDEDNTSTLDIYYPHLKDTIDEENLSRFVKRKFKEETLIDKGKAFDEVQDYPSGENDNDNWYDFLRRPDANNITDPFPAELLHFEGIKTPVLNFRKKSVTEFYNSISNAIKNITEFDTEVYYINQNDNQKLLIDPALNEERKQPVLIELVIDNIGTGFKGESVFCLQMKTPLGHISKLKSVKEKFIQSDTIQKLYLPGIKLCLDPSQAGGTNWGIYMKAELPLFFTNLKDNPLSIEEIQHTFINLVKCSDQTEKEIFERDLKMEELNISGNKHETNTSSFFRDSQKQGIENHWEEKNGFCMLNEKIEGAFQHDYEKQALINNHNNFYVKTFYYNGDWWYQVAYSTKDAFKVELKLLEKHFYIALNELKWKNFN